MFLPFVDRYIQALLETALMVGVSALIAIVCCLALALALIVIAPDGLYLKPRLHKSLSVLGNTFRAIPFIILLIAMLPVTRFLVGTTLGTWAAIVPLSASLIPFLRALRKSVSTMSITV
jgi:D-methionine transport system permease protein